MSPIRKRCVQVLVLLLALLFGLPKLLLWQSRRALERFERSTSIAADQADWERFVASRDPAAQRAGVEVQLQLGTLRPLPVRSDQQGPMYFVSPGLAMTAARAGTMPGFSTNQNWMTTVREASNNQPLIAVVGSILKRSPKLDFLPPSNLLGDLALTHYQPTRDFARHVARSVAWRLSSQDLPQAGEQVRLLLSFLAALQDEPALFTQMARCSMTINVLGATWDLAHTGAIPEAQLAELQSAWEKLQYFQPFERALQRERLARRQFYQQLGRDPGARRRMFQDIFTLYAGAPRGPIFSSPPAAAATVSGFVEQLGALVERSGELARVWLMESLWRSLWRYDDELHSAQWLQAQLDVIRQAERSQPLAPLLRQVENAFTNSRPHGLRDSLRWMLSSQSMLGTRQLERVFVTEAHRRIATTALALHRYRLAHGCWPRQLADLTPSYLSAVPQDPFDGHPLRYRIDEADRFLLYSIGPDGQDQGGLAKALDGSPLQSAMWRGVDVVWPRLATASEMEAAAASRNPPATTRRYGLTGNGVSTNR